MANLRFRDKFLALVSTFRIVDSLKICRIFELVPFLYTNNLIKMILIPLKNIINLGNNSFQNYSFELEFSKYIAVTFGTGPSLGHDK